MSKWCWPIMVKAGTAGTTGEQRPEQKQLMSKDTLKLLQERLRPKGCKPAPSLAS